MRRIGRGSWIESVFLRVWFDVFSCGFLFGVFFLSFWVLGVSLVRYLRCVALRVLFSSACFLCSFLACFVLRVLRCFLE